MSAVNALSLSVRDLHRELLRAIEREHASVYGRVENPYALLRLVEEDPLFAWLKPLTAGLAELDAAIDDPESVVRVPNAVKAIERLLDPASSFGALYGHYLRTVPDVAFVHGAVRACLRSVAPARAA